MSGVETGFARVFFAIVGGCTRPRRGEGRARPLEWLGCEDKVVGGGNPEVAFTELNPDLFGVVLEA